MLYKSIIYRHKKEVAIIYHHMNSLSINICHTCANQFAWQKTLHLHDFELRFVLCPQFKVTVSFRTLVSSTLPYLIKYSSSGGMSKLVITDLNFRDGEEMFDVPNALV